MDLEQVFALLNFYINKFTGSFYTISELEIMLDAGQLGVYSDLKPKYATSQLIKDSLSPFRATYSFTTGSNGTLTIPNPTPPVQDYLDLLNIRTSYVVDGRTIYHTTGITNEDEVADVLNSQINPITINTPMWEQAGFKTFQATPAAVYSGVVTYFKRPIKPVFGYTVVGGRVIVYNSGTSTQLQWRTTEMPMIIIKALKGLGINLTSQEVAGWSEQQSQANYQNINRL